MFLVLALVEFIAAILSETTNSLLPCYASLFQLIRRRVIYGRVLLGHSRVVFVLFLLAIFLLLAMVGCVPIYWSLADK